MARELGIPACFCLLAAALSHAVAADAPAPLARDAFLAKARELLNAPELIAGPPPEDDAASPVGIFLSEPDDRTVRVLRAAETYRAQGKWADAIAAYQVLIDDDVSFDFPAAEGVYIPVREHCRRRMLSLPREAVRIYRTLHDAAAGALYAKALRERSPQLLHEVADRYPISSVAGQALKDAADLHLEHGDYLEALKVSKAVFSRMRAGDQPGFSPVLALLKAAACYRALGDAERADAIMKFAQSDEAAGGAERQKILQAARSVAALPPKESATENWGTFGGGNTHARSPHKVTLPGRLRWHQQEIETDDRPRRAPPVARPGSGGAVKMICQPVACDGVVYYRTARSVVARDIYRGTQLWPYREALRDRAGNPVPHTPYQGTHRGSLFITAAGGRVYANIFHVSYDNNRANYRFKLVAFEAKPAAGEPIVAWERGGEDEPDKELRELSFTSAPIVAGGRVLVGAIQVPGDEIYLCAFDAETGALLWKTFVCIGQTRMRYSYPNGNGVAEMPAESEGVVYFASNVGMAAAVDAATGGILWKCIYERKAVEPAARYYTASFRPNNPPIISNGTLYVLPADSGYLYALDTGTGQVLWRSPLGDDYEYLLGARNGSVIVSGNRVKCISEGGEDLWVRALDGSSRGRGVLAEGFALCPTEEGIELIRLQTGRFVGVSRPYASWQEWLALREGLEDVVESGNLLVADGTLIIAGENCVHVYDERVNPEEILASLQKSPNDPTLHAQMASYYLWQEDYVKAASEYEAAYEIIVEEGGHDRLAERVQGDLFTIYMDLGDLRSGAEASEEALGYFQQALARAPQTDAKLQAQVRMAETHRKLGDIAAAVDGFQAIISEHPDEYFHPDGYLFVRARAFAEARTAELLKQHGRRYYAGYDAEAERILESGKDGVAAAREVLRLYPNSSLLAPCLLKVAKDAVEKENYRAAGGYLALLLRRRPDSTRAAEARDLFASCLEKQGIAPRRELFARTSIFPPLEQLWEVQTDAGHNYPRVAAVPALNEAMQDLFCVVLGKNLYCRRAQDGSLVWKNTAGWLGVSLQDAGARTNGTEIVEVMPQTPAQAAGFEAKDIITEFDGTPVGDTPKLIRVCGNTPAGSRVKVKVLRRGEEKTLEATLDERPAKHDQMDRGYRVYLAGLATLQTAAPAKAAAQGQRDALVISRDRFIQCVDPITGEVIQGFAVTAERFDPYRPIEPTERDGLAVTGGGGLLCLTRGSTETRIIDRQMRPQTIRRANEAALWDIATGRNVWKRELDAKPISDPYVTGNVAVVVEAESDSDTYIACYAIESGSQVVRIGPLQAQGVPLGILELVGGRICIAIGSDIFCYEITDDGQERGRRIWARHVGAAEMIAFELLASAEQHGRELILAATADSGAEVIDAATGRSLWSLTPRSGFVLGQVTGDAEHVYACSRTLGEAEVLIEAFSVETGRRVWRLTAEGLPYATDLLVTGSHVAVALNQADSRNLATGASKVLLLDKATGKSVQEIAFKAKTIYDLKVVGGVLLVVTQNSVIGFGPGRPKT